MAKLWGSADTAVCVCGYVHMYLLIVSLPVIDSNVLFCFLFFLLQISSYIMEVICVDSGEPPLSSSVLVTLEISDVNDNPPLFDQKNYTLYVEVSSDSSTQVESERETSGLVFLLDFLQYCT